MDKPGSPHVVGRRIGACGLAGLDHESAQVLDSPLAVSRAPVRELGVLQFEAGLDQAHRLEAVSMASTGLDHGTVHVTLVLAMQVRTVRGEIGDLDRVFVRDLVLLAQVEVDGLDAGLVVDHLLVAEAQAASSHVDARRDLVKDRAEHLTVRHVAFGHLVEQCDDLGVDLVGHQDSALGGEWGFHKVRSNIQYLRGVREIMIL